MSASPLESMPNSLSAEQAVLGGLMLDNCRWDEVADRIVADDFYTSAHREIFSEMERLLSHGKPIDLITLAEALEQNGKLEQNAPVVLRTLRRCQRTRPARQIFVLMRISFVNARLFVK